MTKEYKKFISAYRFQIIIGILFVFVTVTLWFFLKSTPESKLGIIASGFAASLMVAVIQYMFSLNEYKSFRDIKKLDIKRILVSRDDQSFYSNFIAGAKKEIKVMGVTGLRMMQDFASESSPREDKKVLLTVLAKGIKIDLLLPSRNLLSSPKDVSKYDQSKAIFDNLKSKFNNFEVRYFNHIPTHSIFLVDQECILGPVFSNYESKDTPCIYMGIQNDFASKYLEYFNNQWIESK